MRKKDAQFADAYLTPPFLHFVSISVVSSQTLITPLYVYAFAYLVGRGLVVVEGPFLDRMTDSTSHRGCVG